MGHYYYLMLIFVVAMRMKELDLYVLWMLATNIIVSIVYHTNADYFEILRWECISYSLALAILPLGLYVSTLMRIKSTQHKS